MFSNKPFCRNNTWKHPVTLTITTMTKNIHYVHVQARSKTCNCSWRLLLITTTTHLMALYPGPPGWASTRNNIPALTGYLCGYYSMSSINFIHLLHSITSSLFGGWDRHSFFTTSLHVFWSTFRSYNLHFVICAFFVHSFSSFLETCAMPSQPISLDH